MFKEGIFLICFQTVVSIFVSLGLLVYFKNPQVKVDVLITVMIGWIFGFAGILLLPYDLSVAIVNEETVSNLKVMWEIIYWTTFSLAWIILPIQLE